jgi:hypothetical protein
MLARRTAGAQHGCRRVGLAMSLGLCPFNLGIPFAGRVKGDTHVGALVNLVDALPVGAAPPDFEGRGMPCPGTLTAHDHDAQLGDGRLHPPGVVAGKRTVNDGLQAGGGRSQRRLQIFGEHE